MKFSKSWLAFASLGALTSPFVYSQPVTEFRFDDGRLARRADDFYLRIMPLGASITYGIASTDKNGYRKALRDQLRYDGWEVNMVGSLFSGSMNDSDTEGWSGYRVEQVLDRAKASVPGMKPNLVLINAGTNDAGQNYQLDTVGKRMRALIEYLLTDDPDRVVIFSTLVASRSNQPNTDKVNAQYRDLAEALSSENKHVLLADFATGFITLDDISSDGVHPTDAGYRKLAAVWHKTILEVEDLGWLKPPKEAFYKDEDAGSTTCEKTLSSGKSRGEKEVLKGVAAVIKDDGKYVHKAESKGVIATGELGMDQDIWFAELVGDGGDRGSARDELVWTESDGMYMKVNNGDGKFGSKVKIDPKSDCEAKGIRWGDVNNDGLHDFICVNEAGDINVSINRGGNPPEFEDIGVYTTAPSGDYSRDSVRLADIDGDGRLDYCVVAKSGDVTCWRNAGQGDKADSWQDLGSGKPVFTDKGLGSIDGIRFVDLNGDSRSDYLWMDENGKVTTYINQRGSGKGLIPNWDASNVTHTGMGEPSRSWIRFGRVYGTGRSDYNYVKCTSETNGVCKYEIRAFKNVGSGGAHQKGDGAFFCDMDGNGNDDYIWSSTDGKITIFRNTNTPPATDYGWDEKTNILDTGVDRRALRFADLDGDGKCDVIAVDKDTGAVDVWYTSYDNSSKKFSFSSKTRIEGSGTSNGPACDQGWGVGIADIGLRFADIDGDGRADYLCVEPDGRVTGYLNTKDGFKSQSQIKSSSGSDRADMRFADVNGNGLADILIVDKFTGDTSVWFNKGAKEVDGSSFEWEDKGKLYDGSARGEDLHFANLGGQGRADMVNVEPKTARATAWFNPCPRGGDDGKIVDPELPDVPDE